MGQGQIRPQPRILAVWRILLALCMAVPAFLNALLFPAKGLIWLWVTVVWIAVFLVAYIVYLPLRYRRLSFSINNERILLYSGVLYTRTRTMPLRNVQFTAIYRNPFDYLFGLCSLVVTAAGGRISLPGLRVQDAEALAKTLTLP